MLISKYRLFFLEVGRIVRDINTNFEINIEMVIESIEHMKFLRVDTAKKKKKERERRKKGLKASYSHQRVVGKIK